MYITAMVLAVIGAGTNVSGLAVSNDAKPSYDFRERTRALAFDPMRFFPKTREPFIAIRLLGDNMASRCTRSLFARGAQMLTQARPGGPAVND